MNDLTVAPATLINRNDQTQIATQNRAYEFRREYLRLFLKDLQIEENSKYIYKKSIQYFFRFLDEYQIPDNEIDRSTIISFLKHLETKLRATTRRNYLAALKVFFTWLSIRELFPNITHKLKVKVSRNKKKKSLTPSESLRLLNSIDTSTTIGKRNKAMIAIMIICGLRTVEISRANVGSLDTRENIDILHVRGKGETDETEFIRLPKEVKAILDEYLATRENLKDTDPLFIAYAPNHFGDRLETQTISRVSKKALEKAGFHGRKYTAHSFRHSAATNALKAKTPIVEVSRMLRHKSLATTMVYLDEIDAEKNPAESNVANSVFHSNPQDESIQNIIDDLKSQDNPELNARIQQILDEFKK